MLATDSLPWNALKLTGPEIPWNELKMLADATASDDGVRDRLLREMHAYLDRRCAGDESCYAEQTDLAVLAVVALAAERLSESGRQQAAESLLHGLYRAGNEDDDYLLELIPAAAGRLGAAVVEPGLRLVEIHGDTLECWPHLFGLINLVTQADSQTQAHAIKVCRRLVSEMKDRFRPYSYAQCAARVLAKLRDLQSLPALEEMERHAQDGEIEDIIEEMKSAADSTKWSGHEPWDAPVEEWLPQRWEETRQYLAGEVDEDAEDDDRPDPSETSAEELYGDLLERFVDSPEFAAIPEPVREHADFAAAMMLKYGWEHLGTPIEELGPSEIREILIDWFPRKISADAEFYAAAPVGIEVFLTWLGAQGRIDGAAALCRAVEASASEMQARAANPRYWGMAKSYSMAAHAAGIDMSNEKEMQAFMALQNLGITAVQDRKSTPSREFDDWSRPIRRDTPRCGRNDPCPCGSGRKYKKCCAKRS